MCFFVSFSGLHYITERGLSRKTIKGITILIWARKILYILLIYGTKYSHNDWLLLLGASHFEGMERYTSGPKSAPAIFYKNIERKSNNGRLQ